MSLGILSKFVALRQKGNPYSRMERGLHTMSSYDLILRLIEMLLAEKDKNYQLREKKMNDKD